MKDIKKEFSARLNNILESNNISKKVARLDSIKTSNFLSLKGFGKKTLIELSNILESKGFRKRFRINRNYRLTIFE